MSSVFFTDVRVWGGGENLQGRGLFVPCGGGGVSVCVRVWGGGGGGAFSNSKVRLQFKVFLDVFDLQLPQNL